MKPIPITSQLDKKAAAVAFKNKGDGVENEPLWI